MRVGLQGRVIQANERNDASLVFVIDISGSMAPENRLELVKRALLLLVEKLRSTDRSRHYSLRLAGPGSAEPYEW
jgi:Ca-activated chloride channel family protein